MRFPLSASSVDHLHDGSPSWALRENMLYVVAKPPAELARTISSLDEVSRNRPLDLLHATIQPLGDRSWLTDADIEAACRRLSGVRYAPFLMLFDRLEGGKTMSLSGGSRNCAAQDFRIAVLDALFGHFERLPAWRLDPHMTIDHRADGRPGRLLDRPIAWLVEEFMLVESVHGETRHIEWGRWRLRED